MQGPLESLEQWDDFVKDRYDPNRAQDGFRQFTPEAPAVVREFYRLSHTHQTRDFVQRKKRQYLARDRRSMGIWQALEYLNTLVDDSDPDTDLSQIEHCLQTAEAIRTDGHPRWFVLAGLIHDLGKILCLDGEPQWAVVGDTFPVGCAWSDKIVYPELLAANPDSAVARYRTRTGVYEEGCGFDTVDLSWGHDEYLYHVAEDYLLKETLYTIQYQSFYPCHPERAYEHPMNDRDRRMFEWVRACNLYDLYSQSAARLDAKAAGPYYEGPIAEYFPAQVSW